MGKTLIILGIVLIIAGLLYNTGAKIPFFGKLPGDFVIRKENFTFYLPLGSSVLLSVLLTLILYLVSRLR